MEGDKHCVSTTVGSDCAVKTSEVNSLPPTKLQFVFSKYIFLLFIVVCCCTTNCNYWRYIIAPCVEDMALQLTVALYIQSSYETADNKCDVIVKGISIVTFDMHCAHTQIHTLNSDRRMPRHWHTPPFNYLWFTPGLNIYYLLYLISCNSLWVLYLDIVMRTHKFVTLNTAAKCTDMFLGGVFFALLHLQIFLFISLFGVIVVVVVNGLFRVKVVFNGDEEATFVLRGLIHQQMGIREAHRHTPISCSRCQIYFSYFAFI